MTRTTLAMALLLCGIGSGSAHAQAAPAAPRDVREVFLALPVPAAAPGRPLLSRVAPLLATRELREAAWERALAGGSTRAFSLDARNGYLQLCLREAEHMYGLTECVSSIVVTYFVRANGERLVVMQVEDTDIFRMEDHFWILAGGRFTPVDGARLLPDLTYADFWGDQPLPRGVSPGFLRETGALTITWPRVGTTASAYVQALDEGVKDPALARQLGDLEGRQWFESVELVWNRGRGVFTKGKRRPMPDEDHHHH